MIWLGGVILPLSRQQFYINKIFRRPLFTSGRLKKHYEKGTD